MENKNETNIKYLLMPLLLYVLIFGYYKISEAMKPEPIGWYGNTGYWRVSYGLSPQFGDRYGGSIWREGMNNIEQEKIQLKRVTMTVDDKKIVDFIYDDQVKTEFAETFYPIDQKFGYVKKGSDAVVELTVVENEKEEKISVKMYSKEGRLKK